MGLPLNDTFLEAYKGMKRRLHQDYFYEIFKSSLLDSHNKASHFGCLSDENFKGLYRQEQCKALNNPSLWVGWKSVVLLLQKPQ